MIKKPDGRKKETWEAFRLRDVRKRDHNTNIRKKRGDFKDSPKKRAKSGEVSDRKDYNRERMKNENFSITIVSRGVSLSNAPTW